MNILFVPKSLTGSAHVQITIGQTVVMVETHLAGADGPFSITETDNQGRNTTEIFPRAVELVSVDLPEGWWDVYDLVKFRDGQEYRPAVGAYYADAGNALRWAHTLTGPEKHQRMVLRVVTINPTMENPVIAPVVPAIVAAPKKAMPEIVIVQTVPPVVTPKVQPVSREAQLAAARTAQMAALSKRRGFGRR